MRPIKIGALLLLSLLSLSTTSIVKSEISTSQQKVESFTEKALPIDKSQYNITLAGYFVSDTPDIADADRQLGNYSQERYIYLCVSDQSELRVNYVVENGVLTTCFVSVRKGSVLTDQPYSNLKDAVIGFFGKYQTFGAAGTSEMQSMLQNTDVTGNQTFLYGDLKLKISNGDYPFSGHLTSFMWYRVINGCEYLELNLGFANGAFCNLKDVRELHPIGDTTVNISKEQAIAIAMQYVKENYTYEMPGDVWVKDFNIVESKTSAQLTPTSRGSNTQYPVWNIMLTLDHTYPGSVAALLVLVSAGSGEVLLCSNQAVGGNVAPSDEDTNVIVLPSTSPSVLSPSPTATTDSVSSNGNMENTIIAAMVTVIALVLITLFIKKRKR
ncbi:hypothetical protein JXA31_10305 [Candidatus Bathyarchaeota archaeon]|nr:hypothetical protein [Candidatus Bathyarchaeota archaeon]